MTPAAPLRLPVRLPRSYLYVPGNAPDKLARALDRGADALIVDLEDAVPPAGKDRARADVLDWLRGVDPGGCQLWVRVNPGRDRAADLAALAAAPHLTGIVPAKLADRADLDQLVAALAHASDTTTLVMPLLETASAVLSAAAIAGGPRVHQLQIGEVDLCADTGIEPGPDEAELAPIRTQVVLCAAAAGIHPPVGPVSRNFTDLDALEHSTRRLRRQGFFGRCCIHPAQVEVVNRVFTPTDAQVADAARLVAAFDAATARGEGVVVDDAGQMVDLAVIRTARQVLAAAQPTGAGPGTTPT